MRELEFRAWIESKKKMFHKVFLGDGVVSLDLGKGVYEEVINDENIKVMQFTGILDKLKRKIFEGDILILKIHLGTSIIPHLSGEDEEVEHFEEEMYKVIFRDGAFLLKSNKHGARPIATADELLVIGDIFSKDFWLEERRFNYPDEFYNI